MSFPQRGYRIKPTFNQKLCLRFHLTVSTDGARGYQQTAREEEEEEKRRRGGGEERMRKKKVKIL